MSETPGTQTVGETKKMRRSRRQYHSKPHSVHRIFALFLVTVCISFSATATKERSPEALNLPSISNGPSGLPNTQSEGDEAKGARDSTSDLLKNTTVHRGGGGHGGSGHGGGGKGGGGNKGCGTTCGGYTSGGEAASSGLQLAHRNPLFSILQFVRRMWWP